MASGYVKFYRAIMDWEWWDDHNVYRLFTYLLLVVNHEPRVKNGITVNAGQTLTSLQRISRETGLSIQQTRTAISKLKSTGEITHRATSNFSLITVANWERFQCNNGMSNTVTNTVSNIKSIINQHSEQHQINNKQEVEKLRSKEIINNPPRENNSSKDKLYSEEPKKIYSIDLTEEDND